MSVRDRRGRKEGRKLFCKSHNSWNIHFASHRNLGKLQEHRTREISWLLFSRSSSRSTRWTCFAFLYFNNIKSDRRCNPFHSHRSIRAESVCMVYWEINVWQRHFLDCNINSCNQSYGGVRCIFYDHHPETLKLKPRGKSLWHAQSVGPLLEKVMRLSFFSQHKDPFLSFQSRLNSKQTESIFNPFALRVGFAAKKVSPSDCSMHISFIMRSLTPNHGLETTRVLFNSIALDWAAFPKRLIVM